MMEWRAFHTQVVTRHPDRKGYLVMNCHISQANHRGKCMHKVFWYFSALASSKCSGESVHMHQSLRCSHTQCIDIDEDIDQNLAI